MDPSTPPPPPVPRTPRQARMSNASEVLEKAKRSARKQEQFKQFNFQFTSISDHILSSVCNHAQGEGTEGCVICTYERELSGLPHLPEMIFPHNKLVVEWINNPGVKIEFNTLDALKMVNTTEMPNIQVAPSAAWQESRREMSEFKQFSKPFDWTYTTEYEGTLHGLKAEDTDERIDMEWLKRQDPIQFYAQNSLYEDELHDHGVAELMIRIRVMPGWFFVLVRFFLRVDHVHIRVCDTRLFGRTDTTTVLREWTMREESVDKLRHLSPEVLNDQNQVWTHLPIIKSRYSKLSPL